MSPRALVACALLIFACARTPREGKTIEEPATFDEDTRRAPPFELAPHFSLPTIDRTGRFALTDHVGPEATKRARAVVLHFTASWCAPCRSELPWIADLDRRWRERGVLNVLIDVEPNSVAMRKIIAAVGPELPALHDSKHECAELYRAIGFPTLVLIDGDGRVLLYEIGVHADTRSNVETALQNIF